MHKNIEIKAWYRYHEKIRGFLRENADFIGIDYQIDTYFKARNGRLKLRKGNIENYLIYYERKNEARPKQSDIILYETDSQIKEILEKSLGVLAVVKKKREIYFIENVKFHLDEVNSLGSFIEIEAIDKDGTIGKEKLLEQCNFYKDLFGIREEDLIADSYSDMIIRKQK